jgi:hypothetical protein
MTTTRTFALAALLAGIAILPAHAAGPFDGSYVGISTNTMPGGAGCGDGGPSTRVVTDSAFTLNWAGRQARFSVDSDGTINSSSNVGVAMLSAKGKIAGNKMTYDLNSQRCSFHFEGVKK